jgi:hypothetical protein
MAELAAQFVLDALIGVAHEARSVHQEVMSHRCARGQQMECWQPKSRRRQVEHGEVSTMQFRYRAAVAALFSAVACAQAPAALAVEHTAPRHRDHHATHTDAKHRGVKHHRKKHHAQRHHTRAHALQMPADYAEWTRVADCESGGWRVEGSAYPDSLGITSTNFEDFGGTPQPVGTATRAEIVAQIQAADRLVAAYHMAIPDQDGCAAW